MTTPHAPSCHEPELVYLSAGASIDSVVDALHRNGCVVIRSHQDVRVMERVRTEIMDALTRPAAEHRHNSTFESFGTKEFLPGQTRRISGLVARSTTFGELVADPTILGVCDETLGPNCSVYQVHATSALDVGPGAPQQMLHRENAAFGYFPPSRMELLVAAMWAADEFRGDNGATRVVPGSHLWPLERQAREDEVRIIEMERGSLALWLGGTLHGAGGNHSQDRRLGIYLSFSLGWLRQEENQYLSVPPSIAIRLPHQLRRLLGYQLHDPALGYWAPPPESEGKP